MVITDIHSEGMTPGAMVDILELCNTLLSFYLSLLFCCLFSPGRTLSSTSLLFYLASNPKGAHLYYFLGLSSNRFINVDSKLSHLAINMKNKYEGYPESPICYLQDYRHSAKLFPCNNTDKKDEDEDDGSCHHTLFVHPRKIYQSVVGADQKDK
jgi:ferredoxin-thioredoxin reductase catalytic subunit